MILEFFIFYSDLKTLLRTKNPEVQYKVKLLQDDSRNRLKANRVNCPKDVIFAARLRKVYFVMVWLWNYGNLISFVLKIILLLLSISTLSDLR